MATSDPDILPMKYFLVNAFLWAKALRGCGPLGGSLLETPPLCLWNVPIYINFILTQSSILPEISYELEKLKEMCDHMTQS